MTVHLQYLCDLYEFCDNIGIKLIIVYINISELRAAKKNIKRCICDCVDYEKKKKKTRRTIKKKMKDKKSGKLSSTHHNCIKFKGSFS